MKTLKQSLIFLFSLVLVFSCTNETIEKNELQQVNYDELNLKVDEYLNSYAAYFESEETLIKMFERFSSDAQKSSEEPSMTIYLDLTSEKVEYTKDDLSDIYSDAQKIFLVAYFNEVANAKEDELLSIISKHKLALENTSLTTEEHDHILFLLETSEKTVRSIENMLSISVSSKVDSSLSAKGNCFWNCMAGEGRNIARGIAGGAIGGAIWGGSTGAAGGTVVLPGIGTATGAVGGAVFGAASGAVSGAIGATLWSAADCATQCGGENTTGSRECVNVTGYNKVCLKQLEL